MVTSQKFIKKQKNATKLLSVSKKQNGKSKSTVLNKKKLKQDGNASSHTTQVSVKIENSGDIKPVKNKLSNGAQETRSVKKKCQQSERKCTTESKNVHYVETTLEVHEVPEEHVRQDTVNDKTSSNTEGDKMTKYVLKRKYSASSKTQNEKNVTNADEISETMKTQKRKRVDGTNNKKNADCLDLSDLSKEHILQCISAIFHLTEEQLRSKNTLFDGESQQVFMQVTCIRVPKTPRRCMRILLPHSIVLPDDEVALFVGDLEKGRRKDYDPTVEHYENLLQKHGCTRIKNIIPMNQVKTEYDQHELKRKLVGSYDYFLVDGKIAGHLSHLLGKEFYKKRKLPTSIRMQSKDLKHEIEYALKKTVMQIHSSGDTHIIQIGHSLMGKEEILENILAACSYLSKNYPGGWTNVRSVRIKTSTSLGLPIYTTLKNKNSVKVPVVKPKRPKAYCEVSGELSTAPGIDTVTITPEGSIKVTKRKKKMTTK